MDLEDGETVSSDDDAVHVRSTGYDNAAVQTAIVAEAGSGDITVMDASFERPAA